MELGPQSHNKDGRLGPNSKMVVYVTVWVSRQSTNSGTKNKVECITCMAIELATGCAWPSWLFVIVPCRSGSL